MNPLIVTLDLDWAPEPAIEETLDFLQMHNIPTTVFVTHRSARVESSLQVLDVGLHPYFRPDSSHGATIAEVVDHVMQLPHNIHAFRCHRFAHCNTSKAAMQAAGMTLSSNTCTDQVLIPPFRDRLGLLEVPVFLEDGGYLLQNHSLKLPPLPSSPIPKVILIHPMHFVLNTPHFRYMQQIKQSLTRDEWRTLTRRKLNTLKWKGRGIRTFLIELLESATAFLRLTPPSPQQQVKSPSAAPHLCDFF